MASQAEESSPNLTAQVIGNAFVEQFYHILHESPGSVHRFYTDSSTVSRPGIDGSIKIVTTMEGINELILSLGTNEYKAEILTADAQASYMDGVLLLVTGLLTGKDGVSRKFIESFFLAPQDKGFYVLNDAFRFFDDESMPLVNLSQVKDSEPSAPIPDAADIAEDPLPNPVTPVVDMTVNHVDANHIEAHDIDVTENGPVVIEDVATQPVVDSAANHAQTVVEPTPMVQPTSIVEHTSENTTKKSYASIVKVMKGSSGSAVVRRAVTSTVKDVPFNIVQQSRAAAAPAGGQEYNKTTAAGNGKQVRGPAGSAAGSAPGQPTIAVPPAALASESSAVNDNNTNSIKADKADGTNADSSYSVYIGGLPYDTTPSQVEEVFKQFGAIKQNGIQVRTNGGFCFGFVEFESASSMEKAIEAKEISVGDKQTFIQEKRTKTRVGGGRGGGYRNDGFRGRGNFSNGGVNNGRSGYGGRREFSNGYRNGDAYPRGNQNSGGRGGAARQGVAK